MMDGGVCVGVCRGVGVGCSMDGWMGVFVFVGGWGGRLGLVKVVGIHLYSSYASSSPSHYNRKFTHTPFHHIPPPPPTHTHTQTQTQTTTAAAARDAHGGEAAPQPALRPRAGVCFVSFFGGGLGGW
jgi:hypothetical protein